MALQGTTPPNQWMTVAIQPLTNSVWLDSGSGYSSQWADLHAAWMVLTQEPDPIGCAETAGPSKMALPVDGPMGTTKVDFEWSPVVEGRVLG